MAGDRWKAQANDFVISIGRRREGYSFGIFDRDNPTKMISSGGPLLTRDWALEGGRRARDLEIEARAEKHMAPARLDRVQIRNKYPISGGVGEPKHNLRDVERTTRTS